MIGNDQCDFKSLLSAMEVSICEQNPALIRKLKIEIENGMIVLYGQASSYYGKQIAQESVIRKCPLSICANRMIVTEPDCVRSKGEPKDLSVKTEYHEV
jgi:hypothetical protein